MIPLTLALLIGSLPTSVLGQSQGPSPSLLQESVKVQYPKIFSTEIIECDCLNFSCDYVYWFHSNPDQQKVQFIGYCNSANRDSYGIGVDEKRFKITKKSSMSFTLRINNLTEEDTGIYSCVLKGRKNMEVWKSGVLLLPGVMLPTVPVKTKPKPTVRSVCRCSERKSSQDGCGSLILWPLVGIIASLALALIFILYYFSRLPKKCRHHFVKKR
ncbi:T-cell surface glycoprotein CD8 beta chain isoform X1 [Labrus bergylta]|uniref:Cd8 beta n=1 Tax=Labrus bergylta TaxID=56723 RepID=A0A3Q3GQE3_9LABR|nr:uncharacterized protein LOC109994564 isoform X1 [Labrus bergylta]XP_020503623.1 uncharacterized protein LOC109994564 isoform X1 [Labrus bergylta]